MCGGFYCLKIKRRLSARALCERTGIRLFKKETTWAVFLDVHHNGLTDLTPLSRMTELWSLTLRDNDYQGSLSALSSLRQLEHLDLDQNRIQDLDDLRNLKHLKDGYRLCSNTKQLYLNLQV